MSVRAVFTFTCTRCGATESVDSLSVDVLHTRGFVFESRAALPSGWQHDADGFSCARHGAAKPAAPLLGLKGKP